MLSEMFLSKDLNLDGLLNLDGFKSSVIGASELSEYKITIPELKEIFNLISLDGVFHYADYIMDIDPRSRAYFTKLTLAEESARLGESSMTIDNRSVEPSGRRSSTQQLSL